jgi:hypothetical protein
MKHKIVVFDEVYILFHFNIILKHNGISSTKKIFKAYPMLLNLLVDIRNVEIPTFSIMSVFRNVTKIGTSLWSYLHMVLTVPDIICHCSPLSVARGAVSCMDHVHTISEPTG